MSKCRICYSYAINHHCHGRDGSDGDLCDVCYWRTRAEDSLEQARLLGMGSEREARLMARVHELEKVCVMALDVLNNQDYTYQYPQVAEAITALRNAIGENHGSN